MEITIDIDNPVPQFEQLIEQIKAAVTAGVLKPGDTLPSIRQLANDLDLNSKTVAKAYQLLTRDEIIETKGYRGTYVHPKAKANCKFNLQEWTLRKLGEAVAELREAGVTDSEIRNAFAGALNGQPQGKCGRHDRKLRTLRGIRGADPGVFRPGSSLVRRTRSGQGEGISRRTFCAALSRRQPRRKARRLPDSLPRVELGHRGVRLG